MRKNVRYDVFHRLGKDKQYKISLFASALKKCGTAGMLLSGRFFDMHQRDMA